jgi:uncharacterized membrane protein
VVDGSPPGRVTLLSRWGAGHWLALLVVLYAGAIFAIASVRLVELQVSTWDFGIYQQALWSAAHGGPFYEAPDLETGGFGSFLQVHSAFLLYLLAPMYRAVPNPELLLAVQSAVVALAAVPLFLLTRDLTGSGKRALLTAGLFLLWAPTIAGSLYDFHIEAFLPVELFAVVLFFQRARYLVGFGIAAVAFATMEFAPVLTFFVAVFFAWPTSGQVRTFLRAVREGPGALLRAIGSAANDRRLRAAFVLAVASVVAYYLILDLRTTYLASVFGFPAFPTLNRGYVIGGTPAELGLRLSNIGVGFFRKLELWLLVYALVGFLPLLAPRSFVLAAPVAAFNILSADLNYSSIGFQYGFVFAIPAFVGVAYGIGRLTPEAFPRLFPAAPGPPPPRPSPAWRRVARRPAPWLVALGIVVALNLFAGPLDPLLHGGNGVGAGYEFTYKIPPGYADARNVAGLIPAHATVVATDDLFPLVANSATAYSFFWGRGNYNLGLPFSPTHLPDAVLLSAHRYDAVTPWIAGLLYNSSEFEPRGVAWSTPAGVVLLFLSHYHGPMTSFGASPPAGGLFGPGPIAPGPTGIAVGAPDAQFGAQIESEPLNEGLFFSGPQVALPAGNYTFTLCLQAMAANSSAPPFASRNVLFVNGDAFGTREFVSKSVTYGTLSSGGWVNFTFAVHAPGPLIYVTVRGYSSSMDAVVKVAYLAIEPAP